MQAYTLVGIDDTDSLKGMCTTYLAALLTKELDVVGLPRLIRLNPNIPYRTRGNGAVALKVCGNLKDIEDTVLGFVEEYAQLSEENTNPGVVFVHEPSTQQKSELYRFYSRVVSELVTLEEAESIAKKADAIVYKFKNGRGIIGALAAAGADLQEKTYELIAYRVRENYGKKRLISEESVFAMDEATYPQTFNNVDRETKRIMITPHGYDPILCGIRGRSPQIVEAAWRMLEVSEKVETTCIFETNQGTDAHLKLRKISELRPYDCAILEGFVVNNPKTIEGGHVLFSFSDGTGEVDCAAYEPTGNFRDIVRKLVAGDRLMVYGSIGSHPNTLNLEKIQVLSLAVVVEKIPPMCCNKRMTSAGSGKGFKCKKCGRRLCKDAAVLKEVSRGLQPGFYSVPPRAMRHLSKPLIFL